MPFGCGAWRNIMKGWEVFYDNISFNVGDVSKVSFWWHKCCEGLVPKDEFPMLYNVSCQRDESIQVRGTQEDAIFWDFRFRRNF